MAIVEALSHVGLAVKLSRLSLQEERSSDPEFLGEEILYQQGSFRRVRRYFRGWHSELDGVFTNKGWQGRETIVESDVIKPVRIFMVKEVKKMSEYLKGEEERIYADERTKIAWEIIKAAEEVAKQLLPEGEKLEAEPIYFDEEYKTKGLYVAFSQGTVIGTGKDSLLIPARTRIILDTLRIPYYIGYPDKD